MKLAYEKLLPLYHLIWRHWRAKRWIRFEEWIKPSLQECILDIGGCAYDWQGRAGMIGQVDLLNLSLADCPKEAHYPKMRCFVGDGKALEFRDHAYNIVYSNSVIEHVGDWECQKLFAAEARRVGERLWIQTPARACPVEPHYLGLFIHWFPFSWQVPLARWTSIVGLSGAADLQSIAHTTRLLTKKEFQTLFPDCEIWTERLLYFFPKSYIAIRKMAP